MEKIKLSNGLSVANAGRAKEFSVCLSINVGHVNEPSLGLAALFERVLLMQIKGFLPVFGGTMTAYTASGYDLGDILKKIVKIFDNSLITPESIELAKQAIHRQTYDLSQLTMRRARLLYKHVAFGADLVRSTEEYLASVDSYTVEDVINFGKEYYNAQNAVLVIAGPEPWDEVKLIASEIMSSVPEGKAHPLIKEDIYTGGIGRININNKNDNNIRIMLGWNLRHLTIHDSHVANVLMSMLARRLERAYYEAGIQDVSVEVKVAGYYGLRTLRIGVISQQASPKKLTAICINAINRICDTEANEERMEKSRNAAMTEKLDKWERSDDRALEMAWQLIGRGSMYDVCSRINLISETTANDVMMLAREIFRKSRPTFISVVYDTSFIYTYRELLERLKIPHLLKDDE